MIRPENKLTWFTLLSYRHATRTLVSRSEIVIKLFANQGNAI